MNVLGPGLLLLILVAIGVIAVVGLATFLLGRRSRVRSVSTPCCARCTYPVEGLTSLSCPECGSDLRKVGILTPAMRRPVGPWLAIILWTLLLPIPAVVISGVLASLALPQQSVYLDTWILTPAQSIGLHHLELRCTAEKIQWPQSAPKVAGGPPDEITISLFRTSSSATPEDQLTINLVSSTWQTSSVPAPRPIADLDSDVVKTWFTSAPEIESETEAFARTVYGLIQPVKGRAIGRQTFASLVQATAQSAVSTVQQQSSMSSIGPVRGALMGFVSFWLLVWLVGCTFFYRRQSSPH